MKKLFLATLLLSIVAVMRATLFASYEPYVTVIGEAEKEIMPDTAYIMVGVNESNLFAEEAVKSNDMAVKKIKKAIKNLKIDLKKVKITEPSITSTQQRWSPESNLPVNFKSTRYFTIELNLGKRSKEDVKSEITGILDTFRKAGANVWSGVPSYASQPESMVYYMVRDTTKYELELEKRAFEDARENAERLAKQLKIKIGDVYIAAAVETMNINSGICQVNECSELLPNGVKTDRFENLKLKKKLSISFHIVK